MSYNMVPNTTTAVGLLLDCPHIILGHGSASDPPSLTTSLRSLFAGRTELPPPFEMPTTASDSGESGLTTPDSTREASIDAAMRQKYGPDSAYAKVTARQEGKSYFGRPKLGYEDSMVEARDIIAHRERVRALLEGKGTDQRVPYLFANLPTQPIGHLDESVQEHLKADLEARQRLSVAKALEIGEEQRAACDRAAQKATVREFMEANFAWDYHW